MKRKARLLALLMLMWSVSVQLSAQSSCYGVAGHWINQTASFSDDEVEWDIVYDAANDYITFRLRTLNSANQFDYARVESRFWNIDLNDGNDYERYKQHTNQTENRNWKSQAGNSYVVFKYRFKNNSTTYQTAQATNLSARGVIVYKWGDVCETVTPDAQPPVFTASPSVISVTGSSVQLSLSATDNQSLPVRRYKITDRNTGDWYLATDKSGTGVIRIDGLKPCTDYSFSVQARDYAGNLSENRTVSCSTIMYDNSVNLLYGLPKGNFSAGRNSGNAWRIADHNGDNTSFDSGGDSDVTKIYVQADLGMEFNIGKVRIQWEANCPKQYQLQFSTDGTNWRKYQYNERPAYGPNRDAYLFVDYDIWGEAARYVRVQALVPRDVNGGMTIWEIEVYGDQTCVVADAQTPVLAAPVQIGATENAVTLQVSATDNSGDEVVHYEVDGLTYNAVAGELVIGGFTACERRTIDLYARDKNGNRSASQRITVQAGPSAADFNLAYGKMCTAGYENSMAYRAVDKAGTHNDGWNGGGNTSRANDWIQVDLGRIFSLSEVKIQWENNRTDVYDLKYSNDGTNWLTFHFDEAPTYSNRENNVYMSYQLYGLAARYIKLQAVHSTNGAGMYIWEIEAYGDGSCYEEDSENPVITGYEQTASSGASIGVQFTTTDNITTPVCTKYIIDGYVYLAPAGLLTLENLVPCSSYTYSVRAVDNAGNVSVPYSVSAETDEPDPGQNLALKRPIYSGFDEGSGMSKTFAVDGKSNTRWAARGRPTSNDEWIIVDLGQAFQINRIEVEWETGTSIHYEFRAAYDATFGTQQLTGTEFYQSTGTYDKILSGNFSTIGRYHDQPESAKDMEHNDKDRADQPKSMDVYDFSSEPVYGRYLKMESGIQAEYASSLWEIRVFGECMQQDDAPLMQWAEVIYSSVEEAELFVSAIDDVTSEANMSYEVRVTSGEAGYKQASYTSTYLPSDFVNGESGRLLLDGLIPTVPYTVEIWAVDEQGHRSPNSRTLTFTTDNPDGCVFENSRAYRVGAGYGNYSTQVFQKGYKVTITGDGDSFTVVAHTDDDFYQLTAPMFQMVNPSNPSGTMIHEEMMTSVDDKTYTLTVSKGGWLSPFSGEIMFFIKFPFVNGGICLTQPITYDITEGCKSSFVIFHTDDAPSATSRIQYSGASVSQPILYYRLFTPKIWEDLCMPFVAGDITVYDTDEHRMYSLYAQTLNGGIKTPGYFLLRTQQDLVSGDGFVAGWHDGPDRLPLFGVPYNIRFWDDFYGSHYVCFRGDAQTLGTFNLGAYPAEDDQYQVYGNQTMMPQSVGTAYLLPEQHDEEIYRRHTSATVRPFETYVYAKPSTMARMRTIGRWNPYAVPDIDIEDANGETHSVSTALKGVALQEVVPKIDIFTVLGQRLGELRNISIQEAEEHLSNLKAGCYVLRAGEKTYKVIVR